MFCSSICSLSEPCPMDAVSLASGMDSNPVNSAFYCWLDYSLFSDRMQLDIYLHTFRAAPQSSVLNLLPRVEVHVLDGQVPVRVENLETPLLFLLVRFLIRIELLDQRGAVEIVVGNRSVLEDDGHPVIPAAVFRRVIARRGHAYLQHAAQLDLFFQNRIMVFLEERQEFFGVTPFRLVVVFNRERLLFPFGGLCALLRSGSDCRWPKRRRQSEHGDREP